MDFILTAIFFLLGALLLLFGTLILLIIPAWGFTNCYRRTNYSTKRKTIWLILMTCTYAFGCMLYSICASSSKYLRVLASLTFIAILFIILTIIYGLPKLTSSTITSLQTTISSVNSSSNLSFAQYQQIELTQILTKMSDELITIRNSKNYNLHNVRVLMRAIAINQSIKYAISNNRFSIGEYNLLISASKKPVDPNLDKIKNILTNAKFPY